MKRKFLTGVGIAAILIIGVVIGSLTLGPVFAQASDNTTSAQTTVQDQEDDSNEANSADVDQIEEQVGDQNEVDKPNEVDEQNETALPGGGHADQPGADAQHEFQGIE